MRNRTDGRPSAGLTHGFGQIRYRGQTLRTGQTLAPMGESNGYSGRVGPCLGALDGRLGDAAVVDAPEAARRGVPRLYRPARSGLCVSLLRARAAADAGRHRDDP